MRQGSQSTAAAMVRLDVARARRREAEDEMAKEGAIPEETEEEVVLRVVKMDLRDKIVFSPTLMVFWGQKIYDYREKQVFNRKEEILELFYAKEGIIPKTKRVQRKEHLCAYDSTYPDTRHGSNLCVN